MDITQLEPAAVWKNFAEICAIPHASGNEKQLSCFLAEKARRAGFAVRQDDACNLRIDRVQQDPRAPRIILQGHLDMVPQAAAGKTFDFTRDPITPQIRGDYVYADGTTLGADDGIGVAIALALLSDPEIEGNLSCLFTTSEETGLNGAAALHPAFLDGDILINLDHGEADKICIGCAGGARIAFEFTPAFQAPVNGEAVRITLSGLPGGHSGICIHEKRGNALQMLARIARSAGLAIASFSGGTVDNAIPGKAEIIAILRDPGAKAALENAFREQKKELDPLFLPQLDLIPEKMPGKVWDQAFQEKFLTILAGLPNGVAEFAPEFGVPRTSSNLATLREENGVLHLVLSTRGLDDDKRRKYSDLLIENFAPLGGKVSINSEYPGWKPDVNSTLPALAVEVRRLITGKETEIEVIHAGLEAGIFAGKNPALQMISTSPDSFDIHTPDEHVSISSVREFCDFIKAFINKLNAR